MVQLDNECVVCFKDDHLMQFLESCQRCDARAPLPTSLRLQIGRFYLNTITAKCVANFGWLFSCRFWSGEMDMLFVPDRLFKPQLSIIIVTRRFYVVHCKCVKFNFGRNFTQTSLRERERERERERYSRRFFRPMSWLQKRQRKRDERDDKEREGKQVMKWTKKGYTYMFNNTRYTNKKITDNVRKKIIV